MGREANRKAEQRLLRAVQKVWVQNASEEEQTTRLARLLHLGTAASGVLTVLGFFVTEPWVFWVWVPAIYVFLFALCVEAWRIGKVLGFLSLAAIVLVGVMVSVNIVFVSAPMGTEAYTIDGSHPTGAEIGGIEWKSDYADVRVWIANGTERDYDDLDLDVGLRSGALSHTGYVIAGIGQVSEMPGVSFMSPVPQVYGGAVGDPITEPSQSLVWNEPYRVRIATLPARGKVQFVLAVVDATPIMIPVLKAKAQGLVAPDGIGVLEPPKRMFWPRPTWVRISVKGSYRAAFKYRKIDAVLDTKPSLTVSIN